MRGIPVFLLLLATLASGQAHWPSWRGPSQDGLADPAANPPLSWSEEKNVLWKVELPGLGASSPVIWGDRIYLTDARPTERDGEVIGKATRQGKAPSKIHEFFVVAYDRKKGTLLWEKKVNEAVPHELGHRTGTFASASIVTDGERLYAFYGSRGLHCLDMNGRRLWSKDFGLQKTLVGFGEGASPALAAGVVVIPWDHQEQSRLYALDAKSGALRWVVDRDTDSAWSTPLIIPSGNDSHQVVMSGTKVTRAYDLTDGRELWTCAGMSENPVVTPVLAGDLVYVGNSYKGKIVQAIRHAGAKGELSETDAVAWSYRKTASYVPTPLVHEGLIYFTRNSTGVIQCLEASTGTPVYEGKRLSNMKTVHASPILAGGHLYFASRDGAVAVVKAGREFEEVSNNQLDDVFDATPSVVGKRLYLRGRKHLYCIGEKP